MKYVLAMIRGHGECCETMFDGYLAETYADKAFHDMKANPHTVALFLFNIVSGERPCIRAAFDRSGDLK